jgi:hypothetical protein
MLSVIMLSVFMLSVIMLIVFMMNVLAPQLEHHTLEQSYYTAFPHNNHRCNKLECFALS